MVSKSSVTSLRHVRIFLACRLQPRAWQASTGTVRCSHLLGRNRGEIPSRPVSGTRVYALACIPTAAIPLPHQVTAFASLPQITALAVCAVSSGLLFFVWCRLGNESRSLLWKHYGWFSGLMCFGCCTGAVAYAAWAQFLVHFYSSAVGRTSSFGSLEDIAAAYSAATVTRRAA
jgi:hypothetical protein